MTGISYGSNIFGCIFVIVISSVTIMAQELCHHAQSKCVSRVGCSMALHNYFINCGSLIHGETDQCSPRCKKALISLLSTEDQEGQNFVSCDCNGNDFCSSQKRRMEMCSRDVLIAMKNIYDDTTSISCSLAELICKADTSCLAAIGYYERHCSRLFRGEKCSSRCNNSIAILYRQVKARKLQTCLCDGTEEYNCSELQANTERLCFKREYVAPTSVSEGNKHRHHHGDPDINANSRKNTEKPATVSSKTLEMNSPSKASRQYNIQTFILAFCVCILSFTCMVKPH